MDKYTLSTPIVVPEVPNDEETAVLLAKLMVQSARYTGNRVDPRIAKALKALVA